MEMENSRLSSADPSLESVEEFRVIDSTGSAEYGGGAAQVIISTKSGTNEFHGSLFEYNRNRDLSAKNFFAVGLPKAPYKRNEFGDSLGGPIKRDKLFFFGAYEALTFRSSQTSSTVRTRHLPEHGRSNRRQDRSRRSSSIRRFRPEAAALQAEWALRRSQPTIAIR